MKDIDEISEKVEKRKTQLQPLFTKDKENYDLWAGAEQIFDSHPMAINITGGEMVALSRRTQSSINRSRIDIRVLPPNPLPNPDAEKTANLEEDMYYFILEKADERLANMGEHSLLSSSSWDVTNLGRVPVRVLAHYDKKAGEVVYDIRPMIPSLTSFDFDARGLAWICFETFRSPASIKDEYGKDVTEETQGMGISVSDYWDREHNIRYLTKSKEQLGKAWKHPFKDVPAILQPVGGAPKSITNEGINVAAWGQSIFDAVKIPFRKLNMLRSITATHAHILAKNPTEIIYEDGTTPNIEEEHFEFHAGSKIKHARSVVFQPMKQNDIPASMMAMMGDLQATIEKATYAFINPDPSGHSGAALRILGQDKRDVETPGIEALNIMYTRICRMIKKQIITLGLTIPVKTVANGQYEVYEMVPTELENDFYVNAVLVSQDVYDDVEALQRAQMYLQLGLKSKSKVMEEVLLEQDVPNQINEMIIQDVEDAVPEFKVKKAVKIYIEKGMSEEADMAMKHLAMLEIQSQQSLGMPGEAPVGAQLTGQPSPTGGV